MSNGTSRTCSTRSISLERLRSGPLWFYLYAWPGIFPERWLNTRWQKPLQPPLLRSRHGQCRAAPQHWDLRTDRERNKESRWRRRFGEVREWGQRNSKRQTTQNRARRKKKLFPAVMSCCHSSLLSHHAVKAELPSSLRLIKWRESERERWTRHWHSRHTFALQNEGKREWKRNSEKISE